MFPKTFPRTVVAAEKILVRIVRIVGAMPFFAMRRKTFDAKMILIVARPCSLELDKMLPNKKKPTYQKKYSFYKY
jgi:hypothetical protein